MMKVIRISILITAVCTITACTPVRNQPEPVSDLAAMQARLADSEKQVAFLSQEVARLQKLLDDNGQVPQPSDQTPDPATAAVEAIPEAENRGEAEQTPEPATLTSSAPAATPVSGATHPQYSHAMDVFRKGDYAAAAQLFEAFAAEFPGDDLADNALYWAGECSYANKEFAEAIKRFQQVVETYPSGSKVPDALLKIGFAFISSGDNESAMDYLKKVVVKYPFSSAGEKAEARLNTLP